MYSALTSKKLKLEVKEEIDWKVEVKDEVQLGSQIKLEYSEGPRDGLVFKEEGNLDEEAEQEDNVGPHIGQVPGDLDYIKSGFRKVKFGRFKELMETGVLRRKKDLVNMWNARDPSRVVKIPGKGRGCPISFCRKEIMGKNEHQKSGVERCGEYW